MYVKLVWGVAEMVKYIKWVAVMVGVGLIVTNVADVWYDGDIRETEFFAVTALILGGLMWSVPLSFVWFLILNVFGARRLLGFARTVTYSIVTGVISTTAGYFWLPQLREMFG